MQLSIASRAADAPSRAMSRELNGIRTAHSGARARLNALCRAEQLAYENMNGAMQASRRADQMLDQVCAMEYMMSDLQRMIDRLERLAS